ncbi:MAG: endonuclease/exonuclease/phosphatase family protein [Chloroflexota bacterium]
MKLLRLAALAFSWVALVIGLICVHAFIPQRSGPIALAEVLEPYIILTALLVAPLAFRFRPPAGRAAVVVILMLTTFRYLPAWTSFPGSGPGEDVTAMTWNLLAGPDGGERSLEGILRSDADLIGVQELQPQAAAVLVADGTLSSRLPYRALAPDPSVLGIGLFSRYPIVDYEAWTDPPMLRAEIAHPVGESFTVLVVHPLPAAFGSVARVPVSLDTTRRDAAIARIWSIIEEESRGGRSMLVLGDLNTTEREPAYAEFSNVLHDAHAVAGWGPGHTWRPQSLAFLPFGLLRIDYIFGVQEMFPRSTFVDCNVPSDHCRLEATFKWARLR